MRERDAETGMRNKIVTVNSINEIKREMERLKTNTRLHFFFFCHFHSSYFSSLQQCYSAARVVFDYY